MLQLSHWSHKALAGIVGAFANEAVRLYLVVTGQQAGAFLPSPWLEYATGMTVYLGVAAIVTVLWDDANPIKCLAVGAGLPRIIQSLAQSGIQLAS